MEVEGRVERRRREAEEPWPEELRSLPHALHVQQPLPAAASAGELHFLRPSLLCLLSGMR